MKKYLSSKRTETSTAGVHQMRLPRRHSFLFIVVVIVVVGHWKSFQPQKQRFSSFKHNTGQTDGRTDGPTDGRIRPLIEMRSRI